MISLIFVSWLLNLSVGHAGGLYLFIYTQSMSLMYNTRDSAYKFDSWKRILVLAAKWLST